MSLTKTTTSKGNYRTSRIWNGKWAIWKLNHTKAGLSEKDYRENQRSARRLEREPWLLYILLHCAKLLHFILASATLLHFVLASATLLHCATLLHFILACATLLHCATLCYMATLIQWKRLSGKSTECKEPWLLSDLPSSPQYGYLRPRGAISGPAR